MKESLTEKLKLPESVVRLVFLLLGKTQREDTLNNIIASFIGLARSRVRAATDYWLSWAKIPRLEPYRNPNKRLSSRIQYEPISKYLASRVTGGNLRRQGAAAVLAVRPSIAT